MSRAGPQSFRLVIAEPWFNLRGHPAQSLLNTARSLGRRDDALYVIASDAGRPDLLPMAEELKRYGAVRQFAAGRSQALGTARALFLAGAIARRQSTPLSLFFLDAHLLALALLTPVFRVVAPNVNSVSALGLFGPEAIVRGRSWRRAVLARWLSRGDVRLFLRTEELAAAWRESFASIHPERIGTLPSLEIPPGECLPAYSQPEAGPTRFGVLGQIRVGKGLEWLVPLFESHPEIGELRIAGSFFNEAQRQQLPMLARFSGFCERFLSDEELMASAAAVDYLLVLYDLWDPRLEAATLYLAARVRRPVICYDVGWCGRMISEYGCGLAISAQPQPDFFREVPPRGSPEYERMLRGSDRFRAAHSSPARGREFLQRVSPGHGGGTA